MNSRLHLFGSRFQSRACQSHACGCRTGHPASVDALTPYDEDVIITGASDGIIRILNILPNKLVGIVGNHDEYPVERLSLSPDKSTLASASHDDTVKLWDLTALQDDSSEDAEVGLLI